MNAIQKFLKEEDGVTALEYGLLAALIAAVLIGAATTFSTALGNLWGRLTAILDAH